MTQLLLLVAIAAATTTISASKASPTRPWMNSSLSVDDRVDLLLKAMTLQEKVAQLLHVWNTEHDKGIVQQYGNTSVGAVDIQALSSDTGCNANLTCRTIARNALQHKLVEGSRLGIPISFISETLHSSYRGTKGSTGAYPALATLFPMPITQGMSWNTTLVTAIAKAVATEARAVGCDRGLSPEIQVAVDPRFGRVEENFGADPLLVGRYAVAGLHGLSGPGGPSEYLSATEQVVSEAKHYVAYGFGDHDGAPADVSIPTLYDVYLRPWREYVAAGGRGAMAAHNSVNGQPCHSSHWLLTAVLRNELGCAKCLIGTDFNDINNLANFGTANTTKFPGQSGSTDGSIQAITAGIDQDMGGDAFRSIEEAVRRGQVDVPVVDRAVGNVLRAKFAARLFDAPYTDLAKLSTVRSPQHVALAREAAAEGVVLVQNPGILPLAHPMRIAVVGPNAGCAPGTDPCTASESMVGGYAPNAQPGQVVTILEALRSRATVQFEKGVDIDSSDISGIPKAVSLVNASEVAVVVLGDDRGTCGESEDRMALDVPGKQLDLLEALVATSRPIVLVIIGGRPATFGEGANSRFGADNALIKRKNVAVIFAGRPGEQGGEAIADILYGVRQPSGSLSQPFPRSAAYIHSWTTPWFHLRQGDYDWGGKPWNLVGGDTYAPLWCFGHGLTYSNYTFDSMHVPQGATANGEFNVSVTVRDTVSFAVQGAVTVQIYYSQLSASKQVRNVMMLAGFTKALVAPGSPTTVVVRIRGADLAYTVWDGESGRHVTATEPGVYSLFACRSACDCPLNGTVSITSGAAQ